MGASFRNSCQPKQMLLNKTTRYLSDQPATPAFPLTLDLWFAAKSEKLTTSRSIKTRASLAWAYLYHDYNPYIKKPFERTANNILPQKLENHCITSSLILDHSSYYWSFFELFIWTRCLYFHSCPTLSSSPAYEHMRWPRKISNILRTPVKFSKNPSGKTLQNCFIHKSSTGSAKRKEQNS